MNKWDLLNEIRVELYLENNRKQGFCEKFNELKLLAIKSDDATFISSVLDINEHLLDISKSEKLLWKSSKIKGQLYPPINIDQSGTLTWGNDLICKLTSQNMINEFKHLKPVTDSDSSNIIEQSPDIEDCSLVCSLINITRKNGNILRVKLISKNVFQTNFVFNGSNSRLVTVDLNNIPTNINGIQLTLHSDNLVLKVIEQAYLLTFMGSYASLGSNTAVDTYRITGFFPEIANTQKYDINTLIKYFESKVCLLAIGTGNLQKNSTSGLIPSHDYPVIGVDKQKRILIIRDPLTSELIFEVNETDLVNLFSQLYINWDVDLLFKNKESITFSYSDKICNTYKTIVDKPIFELQNNANTTENIWLLLEKHIDLHNTADRDIAYIQELPDNITNYIVENPDGIPDLGLQLVKVKLLPKETKMYYCHSKLSSIFTLHSLCISKNIIIRQLSECPFSKKITFRMSDSIKYFKNDYKTTCLKMKLSYEADINMILNLQILSECSNNSLRFEVFRSDDFELKFPVYTNPEFKFQNNSYEGLILSTNRTYLIYLYSHDMSLKSNYECIVLFENKIERETELQIDIRPHFPEFNGMPFQYTLNESWYSNSDRKKISIATTLNTKGFIRIVPEFEHQFIKFRCNIFDATTREFLHSEETFRQCSKAGLVISDITIPGDANAIILIEKLNTQQEAKVCNERQEFTLLIGSDRKIIFHEIVK
ncbi:hypothetical protein TPHA_0G01970 [Tetrapisispora phaffii CBS 4417]|uniref:Cysteine protease RIM13 n=1 Tax=Tetrapisispora phaffii (strain ATCC 24235 / CBS 4417 / NBRC 1672 / NRRL Y-8282 / UCD 70-5) TaxID=1071381 RepID=G8BVV5_TETPH|nr:hypothetical protein TPHA_0G01970 [Tetrapisispora phaffii CBS 4417]CCE64033.1 hypothetical protein TPHA_0G01970 [Tetrapisispora phaffii CBS 4417]